ncbi:MAG: acyl-[acyl-carrier-protein] thioesterase [Spirochaetales bacterium]
MAVYIERFRVRSYEVEPDGRLRLVVLLRMLQETAWLHAQRLGKGFVDRSEGSFFWVLSRLRIELSQLPTWGEEFEIQTQPVGVEKLLAIREFVMRRVSDGETIGVAKSGWLVLDGGRGRPVRPQKLLEDIELEPSVVTADLSGIEPIASGERLEALTRTEPAEARHHDIDQYSHVNNAAYLEWVVDALPTELREKHPSRLDLDFLKETVLGDRYEIVAEHQGRRAVSEVWRVDDQSPLCRIRFEFS